MPDWKNPIKAVLHGAYRYTGLARLEEGLAHWLGQQRMTILLFHRVTDAIPEDVLTVHPDRFRGMCRLLAHRFRVVPLTEAFRIVRAGERLPSRTVAIT